MLLLVRHGQTGPNADGLLLGRSDPPLTELGRQQARRIGNGLTNEGCVVSKIISSPLTRALETARLIDPAIHIEVDNRWVEIDYGQEEGRPVREVPIEVWKEWRADPSWRPGGGESLVDVGQRVRSACEELLADARPGNVVVVSHVSPIKAAIGWALGCDDRIAWRLHLSIGSICRLEARDSGPVVHSFNETAHLGAT